MEPSASISRQEPWRRSTFVQPNSSSFSRARVTSSPRNSIAACTACRREYKATSGYQKNLRKKGREWNPSNFWRARTYPCSEDLAREGGEVAGAGADVEEAETLTQVERLDRRPINPWSG